MKDEVKNNNTVTWKKRALQMLVFFAVFFAGMVVASDSEIEETQTFEQITEKLRVCRELANVNLDANEKAANIFIQTGEVLDVLIGNDYTGIEQKTSRLELMLDDWEGLVEESSVLYVECVNQ